MIRRFVNLGGKSVLTTAANLSIYCKAAGVYVIASLICVVAY